jgi:P2 family phage contractile tail tube protein
MQYPSACKNYKTYNDADQQFVGLSDITLPKLVFEKNDIKGAGLGGSFNLPVSGQVQPMTCTLNFHTNTIQSLSIFSGEGARIRCLSSLQVYDTSIGKFAELPEEVVMNVVSDSQDLGKRENATKAMVVLEFSVLYLALNFKGVKYWEIDPFSNICIVNGVDLNAQTRANIG